jgi:hypothetical protein
MVEKFQIDLNQNVNLNAALFNIEYLSDHSNKSQKPAENKENYLEVACPMTILAAIGGDIDIYKYLLDRGVNSTNLGHIGLSRKLKNSVISNVIGASAFYGRINLLHYILEKTASSTRLDINQKSSEKKSKTKQFSLQKEFVDFTPVHLAMANDLISEDDSIEVMKLLNRYRCDMNALDWNKNNILHLSVKFNKKRVVRFIIEDLKFLDMNDASNKEGQTAMAIAKSIEANDIFNYLQKFNKSSQAANNLEDELLELIENTGNKKKKKNKKDKKKKEEDLGVIGTTNEFQETLKPPKEKPAEVPKQETARKIQEKEEIPKVNEKEELSEEEAEEDKNTTQTNKQYYERKSYYTNYGDNKIQKNYKYGYNTTSSSGYRTNPNYAYRSYEKDYNDYDYSYKPYKKDNYGYNNYNTNTYGDEKRYGKYQQNKGFKNRSSLDSEGAQATPIQTTSTALIDTSTTTPTVTTAPVQPQSLISSENINKQPARSTGIVGLSTKYEKKMGKLQGKEKEKELHTKEQEKEVVVKETEKNVDHNIEKPSFEEAMKKESQIEITQEEPKTDLKSEEIVENPSQKSRDELKEIPNVEVHTAKYEINNIQEQEHENEEDYMGDENFITDENAEDKDQEDEVENKPSNKQETRTISEEKENLEKSSSVEDKVPIEIVQTVQQELTNNPTKTHDIKHHIDSETTEKELKELTV